jgi:predicted ABC-type exoprotein transport system permease subunit
MYLPVFWQGVPAFKYWIENTTKTANQICLFTWLFLMSIIWYFTNIWICAIITLIATFIVLFQLFKLSKKSASLLILMLFLASCGKKQDRWMHIKFTENIESCIVDSRVVTRDTSILVGDFQKIKYTIYDNGQGGYVDFMRGDTTDFG